MKIAFFDHPFHEKTKSSNFFLDIVNALGGVDVFYADFHNEKDTELLINKLCYQFDLLIFWQVIPPASILLKVPHKRIVLITMYDACCTMTYFQWYAYRHCHFINFSHKLHTILCNMRMHSLYVRYVPHITTMESEKKDEGLTAFVWRRTPALNMKGLLEALKNIGVRTIVFHDSQDNISPEIPFRDMIEGLNIEYTNGWFNTHDEYLKSVIACDIYVAPRLYEGIGMSFLEAMGLGLCVLAPNQATMNEYIIDGYNGVLFKNFKSIKKKRFEIDKIKIQSRISFQKYLAEWEDTIPTIYTFLVSIEEEYQGHCKKPYFFILEDIKMFLKVRVFPFLRRKTGLLDY